MDLGVSYRNLCSFPCAELPGGGEQTSEIKMSVQKRELLAPLQNPSSEVNEFECLGELASHKVTKWESVISDCLLIQHSSLPVLLEPAPWYYFILTRTNSRI